MGTNSETITIQIEIIGGIQSEKFEAIVDRRYPGALAFSASDVDPLGLAYTDEVLFSKNEMNEMVEYREAPVFIGYGNHEKAFLMTVISDDLIPKVGQKFLEAFNFDQDNYQKVAYPNCFLGTSGN